MKAEMNLIKCLKMCVIGRNQNSYASGRCAARTQSPETRFSWDQSTDSVWFSRFLEAPASCVPAFCPHGPWASLFKNT